jgi:hypothetical protein
VGERVFTGAAGGIHPALPGYVGKAVPALISRGPGFIHELSSEEPLEE